MTAEDAAKGLETAPHERRWRRRSLWALLLLVPLALAEQSYEGVMRLLHNQDLLARDVAWKQAAEFGGSEWRLTDLRAEFERMDLLLTRMLVRAMRNYFAGMREDQVLPIGARELFEPELRSIDQTRTRLLSPRYADRAAPEGLDDLDATAELIRKTIARAPSLPDFSDSPSPPKPTRRLRTLGRPIRN